MDVEAFFLVLISPIIKLPRDEKVCALIDVKKKSLYEELPIKGSHRLVIIGFVRFVFHETPSGLYTHRKRIIEDLIGTEMDRIKPKWTEWIEAD